jgi:hypothetical protein
MENEQLSKETIAQLKYEVNHFMYEVRLLNKTVRDLIRVIEIVYNKDGHYCHLEGCLQGQMCSCGLVHYLAYRKSQEQ